MKVEMFSDEIMNIAENFSDNLDKIAPLSGSPKQVEWANKIRAKVTRNLIPIKLKKVVAKDCINLL